MMPFTYCHIIYLSLSFNELYLGDVFLFKFNKPHI